MLIDLRSAAADVLRRAGEGDTARSAVTSSMRQQPVHDEPRDGYQTPRVWRGFFATNLAMAMGMGIFALMGVATFAPLVVADLGLSRTQLGSLATVGFAVAAATSGPAGRLVDAVRGRRMMYSVFAVGALAVAAMAAAQSLVWLWVAAAMCGASQAVANVVTNQLVAEHIPHGQQGVLIGVKQSGPPIAQAFIGFALPPLALLIGWRGAVSTGVAIGLVGLVATRLIVPDVERKIAAVARSAGAAGDPMVRRFAVYACTVALSIQPVLTYVPLFAFERVGLSPTVAGMTAGVIGAAGIVARIGWGRLTEHRDDPLQALTVLSFVSFLALGLIVASQYVGQWSLWLGLLAFGGSAMAATAVIMLAVVRTAGSERAGRASGVVIRGLFLGGLAGPIAFGAIVDNTQSYTLAWGAVAVVLLVQGALTVTWRRHPQAVPAPERIH
ncbi:MAG: MFS transporter [Nitriliruptorales bacterium]|nr:MFS transporter [Nitriliruptorales bacterium]